MKSATQSPLAVAHTTYQDRQNARSEALGIARSRDRLIANLRLAVFAAGLLAAAYSIGTGSIPPWVTVPFAILFIALVLRHDRVIRECERLERAVEFYQRGLERLEDRWAGRGRSGQRFRNAEHPYAEDLDLFGRGSLFERLCTARTAGGEECLARWLLEPARADTARGRQESVAELRDLLDVREELDLLSGVTQKRVEREFLTEWAGEATSPIPAMTRWAMGAMGLLTAVALAIWLSGGSVYYALVSILISQVLLAPYRRSITRATRGLGDAALEIGFLAPVLAHLETDPYRSEHLLAIRRSLEGVGGKNAGEAIRQLQTLDGYWQMRGNILTGTFMELLLLTPQVASAVSNWRQHYRSLIPVWIDAVGQFEALSALASYAYENPEDPFPTIAEEGTLFVVLGIAHPLLPRSSMVRNDITLDADHLLYVVSGSNMSGKSTLLRSIGANTVLAMAGAPVRAVSLTLSPFQIGASIRTMDSLQEGVSRFYAEIRRLHAIVQLADKDQPTLFLLDEILHGTNSHDRRIGAEAVVRALLERGAVGLLTTHDLALARIADDPAAHALNVHFRDDLTAGKMTFDYRLHDGVVEKSNALELMRAVGLNV